MKVLKNFIYNLLYKVLTIILPFITVPYVTRIFNPNIMGSYNYTASITAYFTMFGMLGIVTYGSNQIAKVSHRGKQEISYTFSSIYYFQLLTTGIATLCYLLYILLFPGQYQQYFLVQIFSLLSIMLDISWLFQGIEDFKNIVIRNTFVKMLGVVCIFLFIKSPSDIYLYILMMSLSSMISQGFMWLNVKNYVSLVKVSIQEVLSNFKPTLSFFLPQVSITIYNTLDRIILGSLGSVFDVGIYTQAVNINSILISLVATLSAVLLPRMTNLYAQGKHEEVQKVMSSSMLFNSIITFPTVVGMLLVSQEFVHLFLGRQYAESYIAIDIVVFALIPIAFSEIVGRQTLIPTDNVKLFTASVMLGAIVSVSLNMVAIPLWGYRGAAVILVIVETVVCASMTYFARRYLNILRLLKVAVKPLIISILVGTVVFITFEVISIENDFLKIILKIILYGIVYLGLLIITKTVSKSEISMLRRR